MDGNGGGARALVSLRGENLVVERAHGHSMALPRVEVVSGVDRSAGAVALANGPVLVEGSGSLDRRRVHALGPVDVVGAAIRRHGANMCQPSGGVIRAEVVADVVLHERVGGPPVEREVGVSSWVEATAVGHCAIQKNASTQLLEK